MRFVIFYPKYMSLLIFRTSLDRNTFIIWVSRWSSFLDSCIKFNSSFEVALNIQSIDFVNSTWNLFGKDMNLPPSRSTTPHTSLFALEKLFRTIECTNARKKIFLIKIMFSYFSTVNSLISLPRTNFVCFVSTSLSASFFCFDYFEPCLFFAFPHSNAHLPISSAHVTNISDGLLQCLVWRHIMVCSCLCHSLEISSSIL